MFPVRQRPPMPPRSPFGPPGPARMMPRRQMQQIPPQRRPQQMQPQQTSTRESLMAMLQDENGQWDFDKISNTVGNVSKVYGQVSPMITKFFR